MTVEYIAHSISSIKQNIEQVLIYYSTHFSKRHAFHACRYVTSLLSPLQRFTQSNGRRPFGISSLIMGFDFDGTPSLYQTDPSGTYHVWKVGVHFIQYSLLRKALAIQWEAKTNSLSEMWLVFKSCDAIHRQTPLDNLPKRCASSWRRTIKLRTWSQTLRPLNCSSEPYLR